MSPPVQPVASDKKLPSSRRRRRDRRRHRRRRRRLFPRQEAAAPSPCSRRAGSAASSAAATGAGAASRTATVRELPLASEEPRDLGQPDEDDRRRYRLPPHRPDLCHEEPGRPRATGRPGSHMAREFQVHSRMLTPAEAKAADARQRAGLDRRRALPDRRPRRAHAWPPPRSPRPRAGWRHDPSGLRRARARDIRPAGSPASSPRRARIRTQAVLLAGRRLGGAVLPPARHRPAAGRHHARPSFATTPAPEVTRAACRCPTSRIRRRLDGGYTVGAAQTAACSRSRRRACATRASSGRPSRSGARASLQHRPLVLRRAGGVGALVVRRHRRRSSATACSIPAPDRRWSSSA